MNAMEKVEAYLKEAKVFYLATVDGDQPKCRPLGFEMMVDGMLYFGVGTFKEVYRQLQANPKTEICACKGMDFLRYYGRAVFETDDRLAEIALERAPFLKEIYNETTGYKLGIFHLEDATAEFRSLMKVEESYRL